MEPPNPPVAQFPNRNCSINHQNPSFNFSAGSSDAGFNFVAGNSIASSRSRPRLAKTRRKHVGSRNGEPDCKIGLGLNGFSDGKLGNSFGRDGVNLGANGSVKSEDLNGSCDFSLGGSSIAGSSSSKCGSRSKDDDFLSASDSKGSSNLDVGKETGTFVFGACKSDSAPSVKLDQQDSSKLGGRFSFDGFGKVESAGFVFGARKDASTVTNSDPLKQESGKNVGEGESGAEDGSTVPDMRGKVKLDTFRGFEKISNPSFHVSSNGIDTRSKNHVSFLFGSSNNGSKLGADMENNSTRKDSKKFNFTNIGKESTETGFQFQNACLNGVFVFGGLNGKGGSSSGESVKLDVKLSHDTISQDSLSKLSNGIKKLNIEESEADPPNARNSTGNLSVNNKNMFVFGSDQKTSSFSKENLPADMSDKTTNASDFSQNESESNRTFPSAFNGVGNNLYSGLSEASPMTKDEKEKISFDGIDYSDAGFSTPDMKFTFSSNNLFPGVHNLNDVHSKSFRNNRTKKRTGKLRRKTMAQQLFGQDHLSKEDSSQENHKTPEHGSPMDSSPYQDSGASNAPAAATGTEFEGGFTANEKHDMEHCAKPVDDQNNSNFSPSVPAEDGLSTIARHYKKKYKLKVRSNHTVQGNNSVKENHKEEPKRADIHEVCEHWRIRGNQAYHAGKLDKAEEFYTMGINHATTSGYPMKSLLLCYSNLAATRMSLGRMREAIGDCKKAAELDPNFSKVTLRAGNCYLVLGEVEDAIRCYSKCLISESNVILDRRIAIEAADGLQKAKRVSEYMIQSAKLLEEGTDSSVSTAMGYIAEALSISRYSERLLEMKGEAQHILRMYDEAIQLCEKSLDIANKNVVADHLDDPSSRNSRVKLWRWNLQTKCYYHLGKLDVALNLIEQQEKMSISSKLGGVSQESALALAGSIRELLCLKKSGNEAFNSGRFTDAIEHYTAAISKSVESRPFMAICVGNRAAAYQSINQIVDAIADCSLAIALDENYQKAISRRATLHEMIRNYKQAVDDLQRLISLLETQSKTKAQPNDSAGRSSGGSVRDLRKAHRRLSLIEDKAKKESQLDLYLILGIKASDTESDIKKAYRKAALRHHPDKAGQILIRNDVGDSGTLWKEVGEKIHTDADRLFKIIGEAYAVLSDPSKRSEYDDKEEMKNIYRDPNRNSNSGHPSTSYSSQYERGSSYGRQAGYSSSYERNYSRRNWYDSRYYSNSNSRW